MLHVQQSTRLPRLTVILAALLTLSLSLTTSAAWAQTVIVRNGEPAATIVLPADASKREQLAAEELQAHVELMSGAKLPIAADASAVKGVAIVLGRAVPAAVTQKLREGSDDPGAFVADVAPDHVHLAGVADEGTLYAAYDLLHDLGVRWLIPGPLGVDVPKRNTVELKQGTRVEVPAFAGRHLQGLGQGQWEQRNLLGGWGAGGHGLGPRLDRKARPDLFYRYPDGTVSHQEKVSEPEVLQAVIAYWRARLKKNPDMKYLPMGPHDGAGFGEDPWDADDFDPIHGHGATTDRYIRFFNKVLEDLQQDYPDLGIAFYAYTLELRPPVRETPNPKILPMIAAISLDRFHSIENTRSWEKKYLRDVIEGWQQTGLDLAYRGYLFNLADHGLPFSMIDIVRDEWPYYHKNNMVMMRVQCIPNWGYDAPAIYLASRLFWDPYQDADAIVDEWFERMYGPSAEAMKKHFSIIEDAYVNSEYFTGNVFDVPKILTPDVRRQMGETLAEAERLASSDETVKQRLWLVRLAYDYAQDNFAMMDAFMHCDFVKARKHHDRIANHLIPAMLEQEPSVITPRLHVGYYKRFWGASAENGYERATNGREIAAVLPDEWLFFLDPYGAGDKLYMWDPQIATQPWQPMKTHSQSASNQGLRYYKGTGWYRCEVEVPAEYEGRALRFWMGGVDDTPRVWIDGQELPQIAKGAAPIGRPFEFDATAAVKPGTKQVVVVSVADNAIQELGTFGINGPVMIWAEPAGAGN